MKKIMLTFFLLAALTVSAEAVDVAGEQAELFGTERLEEGLPAEAKKMMESFDPTEQSDLLDGVLRIFRETAEQSGGVVKRAAAAMLRLLMIVVLCQLAQGICEERGQAAAAITGALAITACCGADLHTLIGLGRSTMDELSTFTNLLLPVMCGATAASGGAASASVLYTVTCFFSNLLIQASNYLLIPGMYAYLALALTDSALQQERLKRLRELLGWLIEKGLKCVVYLYTGLLTFTGVLSAPADAAALKAAKLTISSAVPVVGGIISGAAETVLASAALLKSAIGTFGMLAILAVFLFPFLQIGISFLMLKIASALSDILGSCQAGLLEAVSKLMGFLLAMVGSCAIMSLLSCCCFVKAVQL